MLPNRNVVYKCYAAGNYRAYYFGLAMDLAFKDVQGFHTFQSNEDGGISTWL